MKTIKKEEKVDTLITELGKKKKDELLSELIKIKLDPDVAVEMLYSTKVKLKKEILKEYINDNFPVKENPTGLYCRVCGYKVLKEGKCEVCEETETYSFRNKGDREFKLQTSFIYNNEIYIQAIPKYRLPYISFDVFPPDKFKELPLNLYFDAFLLLKLKDRIEYKKSLTNPKNRKRVYIKGFERFANYLRKRRNKENISSEFLNLVEVCISGH